MILQLRVWIVVNISTYVGEDDENKYQFHEMMMMMIMRFRLLSKQFAHFPMNFLKFLSDKKLTFWRFEFFLFTKKIKSADELAVKSRNSVDF